MFKRLIELEIFDPVGLDLANENEVVKVLDSGNSASC